MKVTINGKGTSVTLDQRHFLARGGEGSVYAKDNVVYKVCEPGKMIPDGKFRELSVLTDPRIIRPIDTFKTSDGHEGYTMTYVPDAITMCEIFPLTFRKRENVTPETILKLVRRLQDGISFVHKHQILLVDLNELNFMIPKKFDEVLFIDVNSYQTRNYPATAIMESIRDRHSPHGVFNEGTDWFSYGIVSFMLFIGMHPFKGKHPRFTDPKTAMDLCMQNHLWIGNPDVKFPKAACMPFDVIPQVYLEWYKAVFEQGKRIPPPGDLVATIQIVTQVVKQIGGSNNFTIDEIFEANLDLIRHYHLGGRSILTTNTSQVFVDKRPYPLPSTASNPKIGITPTTQRPIAAWIEGRSVKLWDIYGQREIPFLLNGDSVLDSGGRIYVKNHTKVIEVILTELANNLLASPHEVGSVMEQSSNFYDGCIIQNLFDAHYVSLFPETKKCRQFSLEALDGYKVIEAKYEHRVLMVMAVNIKSGQYDRFVFRFARDWSGYDVRIIQDVQNMGLNFTVKDNGVAVCINEKEEVELFRAEKGDSNITLIDDPAIEADMRLCHRGGETLFLKGKKLYSINGKKKP